MKTTKIVLYVTGLLTLLTACGKSDGFAPSLADKLPTTAPGALVITSPAILSAVTNTALTVTGQCQSGSTVYLTGADTQQVACSASAFSITVSKTASGNYFLNLKQANAIGESNTITVAWTFDIIAPAQITISSPLSNPYTSSDSSISISGNCETGATVNIAGDHIASSTCVASAFIFTGITKSVDGSYVFNLTQRDLATNVSVVRTFTWVRDSSIPPTPTITNFSDNPHYTNTSPLNVQGACAGTNTVTISEGGANLASGDCSASAYSLDVSKVANGTYTLAVYQTDSASLNDSAYRDFTWVYDSVAPSAPTITNPSTSPVTSSGTLTIAGACETNATVNLSGDDTQNTTCAGGQYSFSVTEAVDGTYNYSVTQTDLASNISAARAQQWVKDSTTLPIPTITTPVADPFISNQVNLILSGGCQDGLTVQLSGVVASDVLTPSNSLTQVCSGSVYSYTITKPDGTYNLSVNQTDGSKTSGSVTRTWIKDTIEPNTTLTSQPPSTNYSTVADFAFSADETGTFECSLDGGAYSTCSSPLSLTDLSNASHNINIRAIDTAGNVESTPVSYTWIQQGYKTIALYHLDLASPTADSSLYTDNTFTANTSTDGGAAKFAESCNTATTTNYLSVADTSSQQVISSNLTLEGWVILNALPTGNTNLPIISKIDGGIQSFEYGIKKLGSNYYIYFRGSLNGTSNTEKRSSAIDDTIITTQYNHIAVTWNSGTVKFYYNGVAKGSGVIGTAGSSKLATSASPLRIGYNGSVSLAGKVDEARISQVVRWTTGFTPPTSAYTAD